MRQLSTSRPIRIALFASLATLLALNFLFARLSLNHVEYRSYTPHDDAGHLVLPTRVTAGLFLNHRTFAADLSWIRAVLYFGDRHTFGHRVPELKELSWATTRLDPYFYRIYDWYPRVYLSIHYPTPENVIEECNRFARRGMKYYPDRYELPLAAGLRYLGHSWNARPQRRLREVRRGIKYLKQALLFEQTPHYIAFVLRWFYQRKRQLERQLGAASSADMSSSSKKLSQDEREFYLRLYATSTGDLRKRLHTFLLQHGVDESTLADRQRELGQRLENAHRKAGSYLPLDLWIAVTGVRHES